MFTPHSSSSSCTTIADAGRGLAAGARARANSDALPLGFRVQIYLRFRVQNYLPFGRHPRYANRELFQPSKITQYKESFTRNPMNELPRYNLSKSDSFIVREYMRIWMILRQCCGFQSSQIHRDELHGCNVMRDRGRDDYPWCELYNITVVEEEYVKTRLAKRFNANRLIGHEVGTCALQDEQMRNGIDFNGAKFERCRHVG